MILENYVNSFIGYYYLFGDEFGEVSFFIDGLIEWCCGYIVCFVFRIDVYYELDFMGRVVFRCEDKV